MPGMSEKRRPLRILYHHRTLSGDGQAVHIAAMVKAFRDMGHKVLVVGPTNAGAAGDDRGSWMTRLRSLLPRWLGEVAEMLYSWRAGRRLDTLIRQFQPDMIYERYALFMRAGVDRAAQYDLPLFLEVNSPAATERRNHGGLSFKAAALTSETTIWQRATHTLPVSDVLRSQLLDRGVAPECSTTIHNAIDPSCLLPLPKRSKNGAITLAFAGFVRTWHRLDRVVDLLAAPQFKDVTLKLIGDGPATMSLKAQASKLGVTDRLVMTGGLPQAAVQDELMTADIGLLPAITAYASPLKLFDYMAAGLAIIASDAPNIREILTHNKDALLVNSSQAALRDALATLVRDAHRRTSLGIAARAELERRPYFWSANAERITDLYDALKAKAP